MMSNRMLAAAAIVGLLAGQVMRAQASVTTVYVFTTVADAAHPSAEETERLAFVQHVKASLPDNKRISSQVAVADAKENAMVSVEIVSAAIRERSMAMPRGDVMISPSYLSKASLRFGPTYTTDFNAMASQDSYRRAANVPAGKMEDAVGTIMRIEAATKLAGDVKTWITTNEGDIHKK